MGIVIVMIVSTGLYIQFSHFNSFLDEGTERAAEMKRDAVGARISGSLSTHGQLIAGIAEYISLGMHDDEELLRFMTGLKQQDPHFNSIYYLKADGSLINSSGWIPPEDMDLTGRPWYTKATEEKKLVFTEAFINASGNRLIMTIASPVYDLQGGLAGVVGGDIDIKGMTGIVNTRETGGNYSFIVDGMNNVIAHPGMEYGPDTQLMAVEEIAPGLREIVAAKNSGTERFELNGEDGYLAYETVEGTDWILASFTSDSTFDTVGDRISFMFMLVLLISLILCLIYLLQQQRYFIGPMLSLENDIRNIDSERDFGYRLPNGKTDIFSEVRLAINAVLGKTQQLYRDLEREHQELERANFEQNAYVQQLKASEQELRMQYELVMASEKQNAYLSYHDHLTGIYNRRFCEEEIRRLDTERNLPISIIMGDVNGLKLTNDAFGHETGDLLLKKAAEAMKAACRSDDIIARWGGDEYMILLPKTKPEEAEIIIERIREICLKEKVGAITVSISLGAAAKTEAAEDMVKVLQNAEDRMYSNKMAESENLTGNVVNTIIGTLHEKSPSEELHSERVSGLCQSMGQAIGMTDIEIGKLKVAGLLHDIGKIAIDDGILNKPGWFTEEEWKKVRLHSEIGFRILSTVNSLSETAEYVLYHHERWDGRGYPKGLKGSSTPVISRIVALADAYDAMTNDSCYRKAMTGDTAVLQLVRNAGTQFDPELVQVFIEKVLGKDLDSLRS